MTVHPFRRAVEEFADSCFNVWCGIEHGPVIEITPKVVMAIGIRGRRIFIVGQPSLIHLPAKIMFERGTKTTKENTRRILKEELDPSGRRMHNRLAGPRMRCE